MQFSSYVNGNAEKLRSHFVAHERQKELEIKMYGGSRYPVDLSWFAGKMGRLLEQNVVDNELREWIIPTFSTTRNDTVVASILMLGTLQKYFSYKCTIRCGLFSIWAS